MRVCTELARIDSIASSNEGNYGARCIGFDWFVSHRDRYMSSMIQCNEGI